ncbi:4-hydroxybenzoate polyprenyltransferase [Candidatus Xenohaliotis californiensis]|uniref:4-hydroxybenzoate polyprenyltransferase n=1 Tax=Candidatus Xenohaliotis californiensis TaxID=84677 RepID=A0ABM9N9I6_9RICK|nr:4-hydroxybenzoate polyprenyltransferase [Candidatus Xenohaliotis californiensis]
MINIQAIVKNKYARLTRIHSLTGVFLIASPCWLGVAIAFESTKQYLYWNLMFTIGALIMRPACCIINDLCDINIDGKVERTKKRPLAAKEINKIEACTLAAVLLFIGLLVFLKLNQLSQIIAMIGFLLSCIYPLSKRFMKLPEIFLGFTISIGVLVGFTAVTNKITPMSLAMYCACSMWQAGIGAIYGQQDAKDDKIIGVNSAATKITESFEKFIYNLYSMFLLTVILLGIAMKLNYIFYLSCIIVAYMLYVQALCTNLKSSKECAKSFKMSPIIAIILSIGFYIGKIYKK